MHSSLSSALVGVVALTGVSVAHSSEHRDIVDTAVAAGSFETLAAALQAADLVGALKGDGPFTVFAPTDDAFADLADGTVENLLRPENRDDLVTILTYHVVPGRLDATEVSRRLGADTLSGQRLTLRTEAGQVSVGRATVLQADIACSNGIIHVIDSVLLPSTQNLVEVTAGAEVFGTLLQAAQAAGLADTLANGGPFTVLAPTDDAFAKLPKGTLEALVNDTKALANILKFHVLPERVFSSEAVAAGAARTLQGEFVRFGIESGRLRAGGANVLSNDIQATNGVIHVIDEVLLPPRTSLPTLGRKVIGVYAERPGSALAAQLGVDPHASLVITKLTRGGPAVRAGLEVYDLVTSIDGRPATMKNLSLAKDERGVGGTVQLRLLRRGEALDLAVAVGVEAH